MQNINLTRAMIRINDAIYQPSCQFKDGERHALLTLRDQLTLILRDAQAKLKISEDIEFNQEKVVDQQIQHLIHIYSDVLSKLQTLITALKTNLENEEHSEPYRSCVNELIPLLTKTGDILAENKIDNKKILELHFKSNLYKLCEQFGALYIPISQGLDPLIGGFEENGKLKLSEGECGGKVIAWIEACANSPSIKYPFYAGEHHRTFQEKQYDSKKEYKAVFSNNDIFAFTGNLLSNMKRNRLYYFALGSIGPGHGLGLRIRQDGILELIDANYFHLFCYDERTLIAILRIVLTEYFLEFNLNRFTLFEADTLQCDAECNLFPHKLHIIQAATKPTTKQDEKVFITLINNLLKSSNKCFKKDNTRQGDIFALIVANLKSICEVINYPETLEKMLQHLKKVPFNNTFLLNETNKNLLAAIIEERLCVISKEEYQISFNEQQSAVCELIKIQNKITEELNQIRAEIEQQKSYHGSQHKEDSIKLALLTQKSIKILQVFSKLKTVNIPFLLKTSKNKNNKFSSGEYLKELLKDLLDSKENPIDKSSGDFVTDHLKMQLNTIDQRFSEKQNGKHLQLILAAQNLQLILQQMEKKSYFDSESEGQKDIKKVYEILLKEKIISLRKSLVLILNDLKLSENANLQELALIKIFQFTQEQLLFLQNFHNDFNEIESYLKELAFGKITEEEIATQYKKLSGEGDCFTQEISTLLSSIQKIINYIEQIKDEYINDIHQIKIERTPNTLIMQNKMKDKIEGYTKRIRQLAFIKNTLIQQCNFDSFGKLFVELSSKVRDEYKDLFPIDFTLVDNYSIYLDNKIERNKPLLFSEDEKRKAKQLSHCWTILQETIERLEKIISQMKEDQRRNIQHTSWINLQFRKEHFKYCIEAASTFKVICKNIINNESNPEAIIDFVTNNVMQFFNEDNGFNFKKFIEVNTDLSSQLINFLQEEVNSLNSDLEEIKFSSQKKSATPKKMDSEPDIRKLIHIYNKISELFQQFEKLDSKLALEVLNAASIELSKDGLNVIDKSYGTNIASSLQISFNKCHLGEKEIASLKHQVITLNYIFRGKIGIGTEKLWQKVGLDGDFQFAKERENYGIAGYKYFREMLTNFETKILLATEDIEAQKQIFSAVQK